MTPAEAHLLVHFAASEMIARLGDGQRARWIPVPLGGPTGPGGNAKVCAELARRGLLEAHDGPCSIGPSWWAHYRISTGGWAVLRSQAVPR